MKFTKAQEDVFLEVCNVGMSKAAKQLSILLNGPVMLENPSIESLSSTDLKTHNLEKEGEILSAVHQGLEHDLDGHALLLFKRDYTQLLLEQIMGEFPELSDVEMRSCEQEAMLEIGNIVISSCITAMVDMLSKKVGLTLPTYHEGKFLAIIEEQGKFFKNKTDTVMLLSTNMATQRGDFSGQLMLVITEALVALILDIIEKMLQG
jgi:chemotaxis protein CheC